MPGMSFIRKYRMALEMVGSPPQPPSAEIQVSLGVLTVVPVHQHGPSQNDASHCQTLGDFRGYFLGPPCYKTCRAPRKGLRGSPSSPGMLFSLMTWI